MKKMIVSITAIGLLISASMVSVNAGAGHTEKQEDHVLISIPSDEVEYWGIFICYNDSGFVERAERVRKTLISQGWLEDHIKTLYYENATKTNFINAISWVAENEGKIVGFAGLLDTLGEESSGEIEPVVTRETLRGEGIGTRLIELVVNKAREKGFRFLTIKPEIRNERAFSLYVRLGFDHVGSIELFQDLFPKPERKWKSGFVCWFSCAMIFIRFMRYSRLERSA